MYDKVTQILGKVAGIKGIEAHRTGTLIPLRRKHSTQNPSTSYSQRLNTVETAQCLDKGSYISSYPNTSKAQTQHSER